ncbi:hypothetical protein LJC23_07475, partial [Desulfovibrio sp. OttesenSCG-928-I05]|nr:hypothetical protein [Desulfovibrio sp. OttesenSCG-928-I05]
MTESAMGLSHGGFFLLLSIPSHGAGLVFAMIFACSSLSKNKIVHCENTPKRKSHSADKELYGRSILCPRPYEAGET